MRGEPLGNGLEQAVAGAVAGGVVELLEAVRVDEGHGQDGAAAAGPLDLQRKLLLPAAPVADAGERIGARLGAQPVGQLVAALPQFGELGVQADELCLALHEPPTGQRRVEQQSDPGRTGRPARCADSYGRRPSALACGHAVLTFRPNGGLATGSPDGLATDCAGSVTEPALTARINASFC